MNGMGAPDGVDVGRVGNRDGIDYAIVLGCSDTLQFGTSFSLLSMPR
jgi:hypothetical protein